MNINESKVHSDSLTAIPVNISSSYNVDYLRLDILMKLMDKVSSEHRDVITIEIFKILNLNPSK